jgi:multiple sugar transport system ATP-binding protein
MAEVRLDNVRKVYPDGVEAVRTFSLDIRDGEFVVLVGPSGCGKSTTLRMVAGLEDITSGAVSIGGRVVNDVHPKDRDIAMVFQNYALYPHMTVYKNMAFALKLRRVPKAEIERRVRDAARTLGIEELLDRRPRALSGGQRQRVAVGRAIVREPKAFLFDEPLSNLDAKLRVTTRAELKALHQRLKTTTIYVTHDQEEAMTLGDRIVVMSKGLVQQVGPPLEVYRKPANRFVASFVGTPPMNFLDGTLQRRAQALYFVGAGAFIDGQGITLAIPESRGAALAQFADRPVVMGLRPQALREGQPPPGRGMTLTLNVVEPLGDTMDLFCSSPAVPRLVARVPARSDVVPGRAVTFVVDMEQAHFFEPGEFGQAMPEVR